MYLLYVDCKAKISFTSIFIMVHMPQLPTCTSYNIKMIHKCNDINNKISIQT